MYMLLIALSLQLPGFQIIPSVSRLSSPRIFEPSKPSFPPNFVHGYLLTDFIIGCYNANTQTLGLRRVFLFNSKRGALWGFSSVPD